MRREGIRHLLVTDAGRLCGVLSSRDLGRLVWEERAGASLRMPVSRIMTEDPVTVAPETGVHEAARLLLDGKIGALPVRDGERIVGIFTTQDALEALLSIAEHA
jgi:acetoin utilization protein AcuB